MANMIDKIERYGGILPSVRVYGTGAIDRIEAKVASVFLRVIRKLDLEIEERITSGPLPIAVETTGSSQYQEPFLELSGDKVVSPFHLYRDQPGAIASFFGARPSIVLQKGMVHWDYAKRVLDGVVENLAEQYPQSQVVQK
jgi:hypothetical protein